MAGKFKFLLLFFCILPCYFLSGIEITGKEAESCVTGEYNRSLSMYGEISAIGAMELNNRYGFTGGFSIGGEKYSADIKLFLKTDFSPWNDIPLNFSLAWSFNGLPGYKTRIQGILPAVSYNGKRAGIGLGVGFRFSSFYREPAIFESVISFSGYVNIINNETLRIWVSCFNFNDFSIGNMGSYSFGINSLVHLNGQWSLINEIVLLQSGSVGLSANFYGIVLRTGARFTW